MQDWFVSQRDTLEILAKGTHLPIKAPKSEFETLKLKLEACSHVRRYSPALRKVLLFLEKTWPVQIRALGFCFGPSSWYPQGSALLGKPGLDFARRGTCDVEEWRLPGSLVAQNLLGRQTTAGNWLGDPARDWSATRAAVVRPANAQSAQLPVLADSLSSCSHDHGSSTGPPRCHIAFAPSDAALLTATSPLQRQLLPACRLPPPSTMADSIRGDGVLRAHRALDALLDDPERLQRDRERFSRSPPAYRSNLPAPRRDPRAPTASAMIKSGET